MAYGGFGPGPANRLILNEQFLDFLPYIFGFVGNFS